jgi:hypothetical protein
VLEHPGHLHNAPQLHFAPTSPRGGRAQRGDQVSRLELKLLLRLVELVYLLAQLRVRLLALELEQPEPLLVLAELVAKRDEKLLERLTALVEVSLGRLLGFSHTGMSQFEEL